MSSDNRSINIRANVEEGPFPNCSLPLQPGAPFDTLIIPPEILLSIFEILFGMETNENRWGIDQENYDAIFRMALMPDSVANVCTYWDFVASLEPKFWQRSLIFMDPMQPNPLSRLQRRLERHKGVKNLRIKIWTPEVNFPFKWRGTSTESAESVDNRTIAIERDRLGRIAPLIQKHAHRAYILAIATMYDESLPPLETVFPTDPKGTHSIRHLHLTSDPYLRAARHPTRAMSWEDKDVVSSTQLVYPDPSIHPAIQPSYFSTTNYIILHGRAFVSFCRTYLTLQDGKYNAIGGNCRPPMEIVIKSVAPFDGGTETPFTLDEFLQVIRLFWGKLDTLRIYKVFLPLPVPEKYEERLKFIKTYPWITWKDQKSAPPVHFLEKLRVTATSGEVVFGITMLFDYHFLRGEWVMKNGSTYPDSKHLETSDMQARTRHAICINERMSCSFIADQIQSD